MCLVYAPAKLLQVCIYTPIRMTWCEVMPLYTLEMLWIRPAVFSDAMLIVSPHLHSTIT